MGTEDPDGRERSNMEKGVPSRKEIPSGRNSRSINREPCLPHWGSAGGAKGHTAARKGCNYRSKTDGKETWGSGRCPSLESDRPQPQSPWVSQHMEEFANPESPHL